MGNPRSSSAMRDPRSSFCDEWATHGRRSAMRYLGRRLRCAITALVLQCVITGIVLRWATTVVVVCHARSRASFCMGDHGHRPPRATTALVLRCAITALILSCAITVVDCHGRPRPSSATGDHGRRLPRATLGHRLRCVTSVVVPDGQPSVVDCDARPSAIDGNERPRSSTATRDHGHRRRSATRDPRSWTDCHARPSTIVRMGDPRSSSAMRDHGGGDDARPRSSFYDGRPTILDYHARLSVVDCAGRPTADVCDALPSVVVLRCATLGHRSAMLDPRASFCDARPGSVVVLPQAITVVDCHARPPSVVDCDARPRSSTACSTTVVDCHGRSRPSFAMRDPRPSSSATDDPRASSFCHRRPSAVVSLGDHGRRLPCATLGLPRSATGDPRSSTAGDEEREWLYEPVIRGARGEPQPAPQAPAEELLLRRQLKSCSSGASRRAGGSSSPTDPRCEDAGSARGAPLSGTRSYTYANAMHPLANGGLLTRPVRSYANAMHPLSDGGLLSCSLRYGIVARSHPLTGKVVKGFLSASGGGCGLGIGSPNLEFAPDAAACALTSEGEQDLVVSAAEDGRVKIWQKQHAAVQCLWTSARDERAVVRVKCEVVRVKCAKVVRVKCARVVLALARGYVACVMDTGDVTCVIDNGDVMVRRGFVLGDAQEAGTPRRHILHRLYAPSSLIFPLRKFGTYDVAVTALASNGAPRGGRPTPTTR
ncbi:hypothetical protein EV121DRAFT_287140 [Schizophyllum commune]